MPDLEDILLALAGVTLPLGTGLLVGELLSIVAGVGAALLATGALALAGGVLLGRGPTGRAS